MLDRTFHSALFWAGKVLTTLGPIVWILYDKMDTQELIALTPAEFGPELIVIGAVLGLLITLSIGMLAYSEQAKKIARESGEKLAYGMDYLSKNVAVVVLAAVAALIVPGYYYDLVQAVPTESGCIMIGVISAIVVGLMGEKLVTSVVEFLRNRSKTAVALKKE